MHQICQNIWYHLSARRNLFKISTSLKIMLDTRYFFHQDNTLQYLNIAITACRAKFIKLVIGNNQRHKNAIEK